MDDQNKDITNKRESEMQLSFINLLIHQSSAPLSGIQGHISNIIKDRIPEEKVKERLMQIDAMVHQMQRQIRRLILVSNIENVKDKVDITQKVDIELFLKSRILRFQEYANIEKGVKIILNSDAPPDFEKRFFYTDFHLLESIIDELLDNAIRYSYSTYDFQKQSSDTNNTVVVNYRLKNNVLTIEVINWGYKIKAEEINNLFLKGYRGQEGSRVTVGSGIGLYVSKKCVEALNGEIEVNVDNHKTMFKIQIKNHLP